MSHLKSLLVFFYPILNDWRYFFFDKFSTWWIAFSLNVFLQKKDMTLKQLIKLENKSKEVWVISPTLHYDIENKEFSELVSVNLGEKTRYKYIVPATPTVEKNLNLYKKRYNLTDQDIANNFLILPASDFTPFITEVAIYDASTTCVACAAPATDDSNEVIWFAADTAKAMAKSFRDLWKKYRRVSL